VDHVFLTYEVVRKGPVPLNQKGHFLE
jgi:hypothetical protein